MLRKINISRCQKFFSKNNNWAIFHFFFSLFLGNNYNIDVFDLLTEKLKKINWGVLELSSIHRLKLKSRPTSSKSMIADQTGQYNRGTTSIVQNSRGKEARLRILHCLASSFEFKNSSAIKSLINSMLFVNWFFESEEFLKPVLQYSPTMPSFF